MKHRISGPFWLLILGILLLLHPHCAAASTDRYFGVDVSQHQGYIDWDTVKSNVDFVIIRCGFGGNYSAYDDIRIGSITHLLVTVWAFRTEYIFIHTWKTKAKQWAKRIM